MEKIRFLLQVPWGRPAELLHKTVTRKMLEDRTTRLCWQKQPHAEHGRTKRRKLKKEKKKYIASKDFLTVIQIFTNKFWDNQSLSVKLRL